MTSDAALVDTIDRRFGHPGAPRRIGVGVSGGSDSLALLHLLHDWGRGAVMAATVDHGLRPEAADEAAYVARFCEGFGIPHRTLKWRGWDGTGNLQDHARRNRYLLLANWARKAELQTVCLGHTLDDQAETFLMRLAREAGLDGLSGMPFLFRRHEMQFERPLLDQRRSDLRGYLERKGVTWIDDPSNDDAGFDRIKARQALEVLKPIGIEAGTIGRTIRNLAQEQHVVADVASDHARRLASVSGGDVVLDRTGLRRLLPELQRRILSAAFRWVASETYAPRREALAEAVIAIHERRNHTLHGCLMLISDMTVRITREYNAVRSLTGPTNWLWDGRWTLEGPHDPGLQVRALGEGISLCDTWRDTGHPRQTLLASPAIWHGNTLVAAPIAGFGTEWSATTPERDDFATSLLSR